MKKGELMFSYKFKNGEIFLRETVKKELIEKIKTIKNEEMLQALLIITNKILYKEKEGN
ncbi:TPA: hypothetical protein ACOTHR_001278 [Clostridium perfringens]